MPRQKDQVIKELGEHLKSIDKILREIDDRSYTWDMDKCIDAMVKATCYSSTDFKSANQFASNLSWVFQYVQSETCGLSGKEQNSTDFVKKAPFERVLNHFGEKRGSAHKRPWRIKGTCKDCEYSINGRERGYQDPCCSCSRPEMSNFKQAV